MTGNGNADGPFIYTGFKPAFIMIKKQIVVRKLVICMIVKEIQAK